MWLWYNSSLTAATEARTAYAYIYIRDKGKKLNEQRSRRSGQFNRKGDKRLMCTCVPTLAHVWCVCGVPTRQARSRRADGLDGQAKLGCGCQKLTETGRPGLRIAAPHQPLTCGGVCVVYGVWCACAWPRTQPPSTLMPVRARACLAGQLAASQPADGAATDLGKKKLLGRAGAEGLPWPLGTASRAQEEYNGNPIL